MLRPLVPLLVLTALALLPVRAPSQVVLQHEDVIVATEDGVWLLRDPLPTLLLDPATLPGVSKRPVVHHLPGTDAFLLAYQERLFRVDVLGVAQGAVTLTDLSPALAAGAQIRDIDLDEVTGALHVLDRAHSTALRFEPPWSQGMAPDGTTALPINIRALAVDARTLPTSLLYTTPQRVERIFPDGSTELLTLVDFANGLDTDLAVHAGAFLTAPDAIVAKSELQTPNLVQSLNGSMTCLTLAYGPLDVDWDPAGRRAYALFEDGLSPFCFAFDGGGLHVFRLPLGFTPSIPPELLTLQSGSGITGINGDLTVVRAAFGFVAPYGPAGLASPWEGLEIRPLVGELPVPGNPDFGFDIGGAPPLAPAALLVGLQPTEATLPGGGVVLVDPFAVLALPPTDAAGGTSVAGALPGDPGLVGVEWFAQPAVLDGQGVVVLGHGARVRVGP